MTETFACTHWLRVTSCEPSITNPWNQKRLTLQGFSWGDECEGTLLSNTDFTPWLLVFHPKATPYWKNGINQQDVREDKFKHNTPV